MCGICAMCWICVGYVWWIRLKWICVGYVKCAGYVWDMCGVRYANNLLKNPATKRLSGKIHTRHHQRHIPDGSELHRKRLQRVHVHRALVCGVVCAIRIQRPLDCLFAPSNKPVNTCEKESVNNIRTFFCSLTPCLFPGGTESPTTLVRWCNVSVRRQPRSHFRSHGHVTEDLSNISSRIARLSPFVAREDDAAEESTTNCRRLVAVSSDSFPCSHWRPNL